MTDVKVTRPKRKPPLNFYSDKIDAEYEAKFAKWLPEMQALGYTYEEADGEGMLRFGGWFEKALGDTGLRVTITCVTDGDDPEEIGMWFGEVIGAEDIFPEQDVDGLTTPMNAHKIITNRLRKWTADVSKALGPEVAP